MEPPEEAAEFLERHRGIVNEADYSIRNNIAGREHCQNWQAV
jgi:hypothetical protein